MKNGKSYIGKTYKDIYERLRGHLKDYKLHKDRPLYRAFNKYDPESFSLEIIGTFPKGTLEDKEKEYIKIYATYGSGGYNATIGGDGATSLDLNIEAVLYDYNESKNQTKVAEKHNCSPSSIRRVLIANNIAICTEMKEVNKQKRRKIYSSTLDKEFAYSKECAEYLLESGIVKNLSVESVSAGVRKACLKIRPTYKKHIFDYID